MMHSRVAAGFALVLLAATLSDVQPALAQTAPPVEARQTQTAPPSQQPIPTGRSAEETQRAFYQVLKQYPPALGYVLRLDPTLLNNSAYLAAYPGVAAFIAQAPDVPRNPGYYLAQFSPSYQANTPADPQSRALTMWEGVLEFLGAFAVLSAVVVALFAALRYIAEYRRWQRVSKMNAEVHNKILDRFGSNEELLAYIDSPAGRRFLEATPIAQPAPPARSVGAPFGRILVSVQVGIILLALGAGFLIIASDSIEEVRPVLNSLAVLGFALGIGAIGSAGASYTLSRKLGLLQDTAGARPQDLA